MKRFINFSFIVIFASIITSISCKQQTTTTTENVAGYSTFQEQIDSILGSGQTVTIMLREGVSIVPMADSDSQYLMSFY